MAPLDDRTPSRKKKAATHRFRARLEPVPHGGLYVVVPADIAEAARLRHGARVRGTVNGVEYRTDAVPDDLEGGPGTGARAAAAWA